MKNPFIALFFLLPTFLLGNPITTTDFQTGNHRALQEGKLHVVFFEASYCAPCQLMKEYTWTDSRVEDFCEANAVLTFVDGQTFDGLDLTSKYKVGSYPTTVVFNSWGSEVGRLPNSVSAELLSAFLERHNTPQNRSAAHVNTALEQPISPVAESTAYVQPATQRYEGYVQAFAEQPAPEAEAEYYNPNAEVQYAFSNVTNSGFEIGSGFQVPGNPVLNRNRVVYTGHSGVYTNGNQTAPPKKQSSQVMEMPSAAEVVQNFIDYSRSNPVLPDIEESVLPSKPAVRPAMAAYEQQENVVGLGHSPLQQTIFFSQESDPNSNRIVAAPVIGNEAATVATTYSNAAAGSYRFSVQVGAFQSLQNAVSAQKNYINRYNLPTTVLTPMDGSGLYRVVVGDFTDAQSAEDLKASLARVGEQEAFVRVR